MNQTALLATAVWWACDATLLRPVASRVFGDGELHALSSARFPICEPRPPPPCDRQSGRTGTHGGALCLEPSPSSSVSLSCSSHLRSDDRCHSRSRTRAPVVPHTPAHAHEADPHPVVRVWRRAAGVAHGVLLARLCLRPDAGLRALPEDHGPAAARPPRGVPRRDARRSVRPWGGVGQCVPLVLWRLHRA